MESTVLYLESHCPYHCLQDGSRIWHYGNALQVASVGGHDKVVRILIDAGADVNAQGGEYGKRTAGGVCQIHPCQR